MYTAIVLNSIPHPQSVAHEAKGLRIDILKYILIQGPAVITTPSYMVRGCGCVH
jgi:hypothetical protein